MRDATSENSLPAVSDEATKCEVSRIARLLNGVKQRVNRPKIPQDICYAGVGYRLPDPPRVAAALIYARLGPLLDGMSLDRIDPAGHYEIGNLRYATPGQQTANRRPVKRCTQEDEGDDEH